MIASEVMLEHAVVLRPDMSVVEATREAAKSTLDIVPIVDDSGFYRGAVSKSVLVDNVGHAQQRVMEICCTDAIVCEPNFALEHLAQDAQSTVSHQTILVVAADGHYCGVIPQVHWAVDEAKTQSGQPRNRLEARTASMHLTWRCIECGELADRNHGIPVACPACGAGPTSIALYTED